LKEHFETLRKADQVAIKLDRRWTRERLQTHNDLLNKWREATDKDREAFARKETLDSLTREFATYKDITAKALTLAEGKSKGFDVVRAGVTFILGVAVAFITAYAVFRGH
jgi:hypothetical protein